MQISNHTKQKADVTKLNAWVSMVLLVKQIKLLVTVIYRQLPTVCEVDHANIDATGCGREMPKDKSYISIVYTVVT